MTHADLTDADITAALERIGPVEPAQAAATSGRGARARPGGAELHQAGN
jgi:hypothetical protein